MADPVISIDVPADVQPGQKINVPLNSLDLKSVIPQEFHDRTYLKKFDDNGKFKFNDFIKSFDEAQTALGKKPSFAAPAADAPDEVWGQFFDSLKPKTADEYTFDEGKDIPQELKASPEMLAQFKNLFHQAGVPVKMAKKIETGWNQLMLQLHKKEQEAKLQQDNQFEELMKQSFGEERDQKIETAKKVMSYLLPETMHPLLGKLPNEALQIMAVMANAVKDKYMTEDELPTGQQKGTTLNDLQVRLRDTLTKMSKMDPMDKNKQVLAQEAQTLSQQIAKLKAA